MTILLGNVVGLLFVSKKCKSNSVMCNDLIKYSVLVLLTTEMQVLVLVLYSFCKKKKKKWYWGIPNVDVFGRCEEARDPGGNADRRTDRISQKLVGKTPNSNLTYLSLHQ